MIHFLGNPGGLTRRRLGRLLSTAAVLAGAASPSAPARAQYAGSIPFNPWGGAYQSFVYPVAPNNGAVPNAMRVRSGEFGFASNLDSGLSPLDVGLGLGSTGFGAASAAGPTGPLDARYFGATGGRYVPYNAAYRRFDNSLGRVYNPNAEADSKYYGNRDEFDALYNKYLSERDSKKRDELRKQLEQIRSAVQKDRGFSTRRDGPVAPGNARTAPGGRRGAGSRDTAPTPTGNLATRPLDLLPPVPGGVQLDGPIGGPTSSLAAFGVNRDYAGLDRSFLLRRPERDGGARRPTLPGDSAREVIERTLRPSAALSAPPIPAGPTGGRTILEDDFEDLGFNDGINEPPPSSGIKPDPTPPPPSRVGNPYSSLGIRPPGSGTSVPTLNSGSRSPIPAGPPASGRTSIGPSRPR